jgi:hypothetical protein
VPWLEILSIIERRVQIALVQINSARKDEVRDVRSMYYENSLFTSAYSGANSFGATPLYGVQSTLWSIISSFVGTMVGTHPPGCQ